MKIVIILILGLLFLFPLPAFEGAKAGLLLWFQTVLPSLLPFIIISNLIIKLNITTQISLILYPTFKKVFPISRHGCYPILIGFLSGMPMGAKATADLLKANKIEEREANFLFTMCNNTSPMFIMSYIAINQLQLPKLKYTLFLFIYGSAIISALIYNFLYHLTKRRQPEKSYFKKVQNIPTKDRIADIDKSTEHFSIALLDGCIMDGFEVITKIGGYIMLFSIFVSILLKILGQPNIISLSLIGLLELTNGVNYIAGADLTLKTKIVLISVITSFGGLSGFAQTQSVIKDSRLSIRDYIITKGISMCITALLLFFYVSVILQFP